MKNVNVTPGAMDVITNIQGMRAVIKKGYYYDAIKDFQELQAHPIDVLRGVQEVLIPLYNKAIKVS